LPETAKTAGAFIIRTPRENNLQEILDMVKIIAQTRMGQEKNGNEFELFKSLSYPI
jgi:hypothetical protein